MIRKSAVMPVKTLPLLQIIGAVSGLRQHRFCYCGRKNNSQPALYGTESDIIVDDEDTSLTDVLQNTGGFLMGVRPDAQGHAYIARRVLDERQALSTCRHTRTKQARENVKLGGAFFFMPVEKAGEMYYS